MYRENPKTIMLFGSFDGIHPGHEFLVNAALSYGSKIILVVAQDSMIFRIKKHSPQYTISLRIKNLQERFPEIVVVAGDESQGTWSAIHNYQPDLILVGYDQHGLHEALKKIQEDHSFELAQADSFFPKKYKSHLLRRE